MNIVIVNPSLFTPFYDHHFCKALIEGGDQVTVVGRPMRQHERSAYEGFDFSALFYRGVDREEATSLRTPLERIQKGLEHVSGLRALNKLAAEKDADIVHFQWLMIPLLDRIALARLRRRYGLVLTVHNAEITAHDASGAVGRLGAMLQTLDQRQAVLSFDRFVVHSENSLRRLVQLGVNPDAILHLSHPPLTLDAPPLPAHLPPAGSPRHILFFGNIKPYKGVETLIDAGIELSRARRDFLITVAGKPGYSMDAILARVSEAGAEDVFRFDLEYLSDAKLAAYLVETGMVVFPYREIDGSGALSHAITFEKPVIASRIGGFSESPFREHIELVPVNDSAALAATLGRLLDEPARLEQLAMDSRTLRAALPSWAAFAQACQKMYQQIADARTKV